MQFRKYQHIERFGKEEVQDIELGKLFIFPKLDGSNGSCWLDENGEVQAGSRNRPLTLDYDNQGFYAYILENENIKNYLKDHPHHRLYGEWLTPHSFHNYRENAWNKFYIFDVVYEYLDEEGNFEYLSYDNYQPKLEKYGLDYVIPICKITNGSYDAFLKALEKSTFLVDDKYDGPGEGIVIKNYNYKNKYGRIIWAKIVTQEFKEKNAKHMGIAELEAKKMVEEEIVEKYCTPAFIEKEYAKMVSDSEWYSKRIPELFGRVFSELIKEESWNFIKEFKNPTINYKTLNSLVINKIKEVKSDLFT